MRRSTVLVLCSAVAVAGVLVGYFYATHEANKEALQNFYLNSALAAKSDAAVLAALRSGETEKAFKLLGGLLEGELVSLGTYEQNLSPSERSSKVYESVAAVRAYYERFATAERPAYGKEGLALKRQ